MFQQRQQGMTLIGMAIIAAIVGMAFLVVMKLWTIYFDAMGVTKAMDNVKKQPDAQNITQKAAYDIMFKQFNIDRIDSVKKEHVTIERIDKVPTLRVKYEVRVNIAGNVDAVVFFDKTMPLVGGKVE